MNVETGKAPAKSRYRVARVKSSEFWETMGVGPCMVMWQLGIGGVAGPVLTRLEREELKWL